MVLRSEIKAVLRCYRGVKLPDASSLDRQLEAVVVGQTEFNQIRSGATVELTVASSIPALSTRDGFPIHGWYLDNDGEAVILRLFADHGNRICLLEFSKANPTLEIRNWPPKPEAVNVQVLSYKADRYDFDPKSGWSI